MKHLCGRSVSQSFTGAVIQSVFDHLKFLARNVCQLAFLRHVLPQQAIEVFAGATLPTSKGPGNVARGAQRFINFGVPADFFPVVIGQRLEPGFKRLERLDDRRTNQVLRGLREVCSVHP